jgi:hypothetical protein
MSGEDNFHGVDVGFDDDGNDNDDWGREGGETSSSSYSSGVCKMIWGREEAGGRR